MSALPAAWQPPEPDLEVGASEIACILGIDPFKTAAELYESKRLNRPFEGNPNTRRGEYFEPALTRWHADLAGATDVAPAFICLPTVEWAALRRPWQLPQLQARHPLHPWARATPDALVTCVPVTRSTTALVSLDVKCPSSQSKKLVGGDWEKQWDEALQLSPIHYRAQVLFQLGVCRAAGIPVEYGELAAGPFFGRLHRILVEPDDAFFAMALERASTFRECVRSGAPLPAEFTKGEVHV